MNRFIKKHYYSFFLGLILLIASFLRLYKLDQIPPSPYWEEVALGYDAYSIAQTGKDHHGNPIPIVAFPSFGDYKPSGYFYALVPFIKLLGLNLWAVRLPSAIAGIVSTALVFLIGKELFEKRIGLASSVLFAVSPWSIHFSRGGWEANLAMCMLLAGSYFILVARRRPLVLLPATLLFSLSMYTYHAARLFAPIVGVLGGLLLIAYWSKQTQSFKLSHPRKILGLTIFFSLVLATIFISPFLLSLNDKSVSSRFTDTSIFSDLQPILDSNAAISAHGNTVFARLMYHRYWYFSEIISKQWVAHFSPSFLFVRGDGSYRHGGWTGLLHPLDGVFIVISLAAYLVTLKKIPQSKVIAINHPALILLLWIGLAALPAALVRPAPHALRFLFACPAFALLSGFGAVQLQKRLKSHTPRIAVWLLVCVYLFSVTSYLYRYYSVYPVIAANDWQYGYQQLYDALGKEKRAGEQVYVTREQGRPAMYYLFYSRFDPAKLQSMEMSLPKDQLELLQIEEYHFIDANGSEKGLFATSAEKVDPKATVVSSIIRPDGTIAWMIWRR